MQEVLSKMTPNGKVSSNSIFFFRILQDSVAILWKRSDIFFEPQVWSSILCLTAVKDLFEALKFEWVNLKGKRSDEETI